MSASTSSVAVFNVYIKDEKFDYRLNISMFVYQNLANPKNYNTEDLSGSEIVYFRQNLVGHYIINFSKNGIFGNI